MPGFFQQLAKESLTFPSGGGIESSSRLESTESKGPLIDDAAAPLSSHSFEKSHEFRQTGRDLAQPDRGQEESAVTTAHGDLLPQKEEFSKPVSTDSVKTNPSASAPSAEIQQPSQTTAKTAEESIPPSHSSEKKKPSMAFQDALGTAMAWVADNDRPPGAPHEAEQSADPGGLEISMDPASQTPGKHGSDYRQEPELEPASQLQSEPSKGAGTTITHLPSARGQEGGKQAPAQTAPDSKKPSEARLSQNQFDEEQVPQKPPIGKPKPITSPPQVESPPSADVDLGTFSPVSPRLSIGSVEIHIDPPPPPAVAPQAAQPPLPPKPKSPPLAFSEKQQLRRKLSYRF